MAGFKEVKEKFNGLSKQEKENLLKDIYQFSGDMKLFLESPFTDTDTGKEFIELYNPTNSDIDLKDWSLKITASGSQTPSSLAKLGSSKDDRTLIKSKRFLLLGFNGYSATPTADVKRSASLPNSSATISLTSDSGAIIDSTTYDGSIKEGNSWERESYDSNSFKAESSPSPTNSL